MERVKSENNPNIEWEYRFEKIFTEFPVAVMYYKGRKALVLKEEQHGHRVVVEYEYRFIDSYCSIFICYNKEVAMCEKNNKISNNVKIKEKNKLVEGCALVEKKFIEIIEEVKAVI